MVDTSEREGERPFFSIYAPGRRRGTPLRLRLLVIGGSFMLALISQALWPQSDTFRIVTPRGSKIVTVGMTRHRVEAALGSPIGTEANGAQRCFRYGYPTLKAPSFEVHVACFEDERLRSLTTKRFTAEQIDPAALPRVPESGG